MNQTGRSLPAPRTFENVVDICIVPWEPGTLGVSILFASGSAESFPVKSLSNCVTEEHLACKRELQALQAKSTEALASIAKQCQDWKSEAMARRNKEMLRFDNFAKAWVDLHMATVPARREEQPSDKGLVPLWERRPPFNQDRVEITRPPTRPECGEPPERASIKSADQLWAERMDAARPPRKGPNYSDDFQG